MSSLGDMWFTTLKMTHTLSLCTAALLAAAASSLAVDSAPITGKPVSSTQANAFDWKQLNTRAAGEYLKPVHPGMPGKVPFWNAYSTQFTYVPAFGLSEIAQASQYRFE